MSHTHEGSKAMALMGSTGSSPHPFRLSGPTIVITKTNTEKYNSSCPLTTESHLQNTSKIGHENHYKKKTNNNNNTSLNNGAIQLSEHCSSSVFFSAGCGSCSCLLVPFISFFTTQPPACGFPYSSHNFGAASFVYSYGPAIFLEIFIKICSWISDRCYCICLFEHTHFDLLSESIWKVKFEEKGQLFSIQRKLICRKEHWGFTNVYSCPHLDLFLEVFDVLDR